jgi:hypothetical protein
LEIKTDAAYKPVRFPSGDMYAVMDNGSVRVNKVKLSKPERRRRNLNGVCNGNYRRNKKLRHQELARSAVKPINLAI